MNAARTATPSIPQLKRKRPQYDHRDGLECYLNHPENYQQLIHSLTPLAVTIEDKFPKAYLHWLILPRQEDIQRVHPLVALQDPVFLQQIRTHAQEIKQLAQEALRTRLGAKVRLEEDFIEIGVHSSPSMNHLHIHVFSKDRTGQYMKTRKHYNTFMEPFLVPLSDFPLADKDPRLDAVRQQQLVKETTLKCWKCHKDFGNRFSAFRIHLEEEWSRLREPVAVDKESASNE